MNEILIKRICKLIAMNYALPENRIWNIYLKLNSIDKLIELINNNELEQYHD